MGVSEKWATPFFKVYQHFPYEKLTHKSACPPEKQSEMHQTAALLHQVRAPILRTHRHGSLASSIGFCWFIAKSNS